jgi:hypothetical protein
LTNKKIAAGLAAACLPLMMLAISTPAASAEESVTSGVSSSVIAKDRCQWFIGGFSGNLTLSSAEKFEGEALVVSSTITGLTLGLSGSTDENAGISGSSTECSFYNDEQQGAAKFTLGDVTTFDATYMDGTAQEDADMDFTLTEGDGLDLVANIESCTGFSKNDADFRLAAATANVFAKTSVDNLYAAAAGPRCSPSIAVSTTIPESNGAPAGAGKTYSFTGPSLVITLVTEDYTPPVE